MLVLFDIDDTLIDHSSAVAAGVTALHGRVQPDATPSAFHAAWVTAMKDHFPRYLRGDVDYQGQRRARLRQVVDARLSDTDADRLFVTYFEAYRSAWSIFPDVLRCLDDLAEHRLGIISNGHGPEQRAKLENTGIASRFASIHISAECGHAKPAREIFSLACRAAGVEPHEAVYVGDLYEIDAVGARQAGLRGIWLDRVRSDGGGHHAPPIIHGLGELTAALRHP